MLLLLEHLSGMQLFTLASAFEFSSFLIDPYIIFSVYVAMRR
jgi:hypothetical protein